MGSLPNRFNKNLMVDLEFETRNTQIKVTRRIPSKLELNIDGVDFKRAGSKNAQAKLEEYLDFDLNSWKSFISMSINDFKNFMILTPEEKRLLLDRLFNLELINDVHDVLKKMKSPSMRGWSFSRSSPWRIARRPEVSSGVSRISFRKS